LIDPFPLTEAARGAIERGATGVLINCVPVDRTLRFLEALADAARGGVRIGAYANAGLAEATNGWEFAPSDPDAYARAADAWLAAGATIVGGCCGTGPKHTAALAQRHAPRG
jgi:S-methylmethionine-dependent homocysteine/selenocysteine methylase